MNFDHLAPFHQAMESRFTGGKRQHRRLAFLDQILAPRRILLAGEGNGRFLPARMEPVLACSHKVSVLSHYLDSQPQGISPHEPTRHALSAWPAGACGWHAVRRVEWDGSPVESMWGEPHHSEFHPDHPGHEMPASGRFHAGGRFSKRPGILKRPGGRLPASWQPEAGTPSPLTHPPFTTRAVWGGQGHWFRLSPWHSGQASLLHMKG